MFKSFATPWTVAVRLLCPWDFPGKNTGVGCHFLLQGIFPTWGSNPSLLYWQADSLPLSHQGSQFSPTYFIILCFLALIQWLFQPCTEKYQSSFPPQDIHPPHPIYPSSLSSDATPLCHCLKFILHYVFL